MFGKLKQFYAESENFRYYFNPTNISFIKKGLILCNGEGGGLILWNGEGLILWNGEGGVDTFEWGGGEGDTIEWGGGGLLLWNSCLPFEFRQLCNRFSILVNYYFPFPDFPLFFWWIFLSAVLTKKTLNTSHVKNIEANVKSFQVYNLWVMPIPKL